MIKKITSLFLMLGVVSMTSGFFFPVTSMAASISQASALFGRLKLNTPAEFVIVQYKTPTGVAAGGSIGLDFGTSFTLGTLSYTNIDMAISTSSACTAWTEATLAGTPSGATWGATVTAGSGGTVNIVSGTGTVPAGYCIKIKLGTAAVSDGTGQASDVSITTSTDPIIIITGTDTGVITVALVDDDQVMVTASVAQTIGFDLDTTTPDLDTDVSPYYSNGFETNTPYQVPLGVLDTASVKSSGGSINMIIAEAFTNASGGMNITVQNANGANGLVSTSIPTDKIPSATAAMVAGTANYGICVATADLVGLTNESPYNSGTCVLSGINNNVVSLSQTPTSILSSAGPIADSHAEIVVNAAISTATPSHYDYTDTLTFIATASY